MKYSIVTNNTKTKNVVLELLRKYPTLHTDKEVEKTALSNLYMIDNNKKYYINNGCATQLNDTMYRIEVEV